jgi:hypothetical protein
MNKYYFHFGDYYGDGHKQYSTLCLQSPKTKEELQAIIEKVKSIHSIFDNWEGGLARQYNEPHIGEVAWEEIIKLGYPYEKLGEFLDDIEFDIYKNWEELKELNYLPAIYVNIEFIMDVWIFVLNYYGAELEEVEVEDDNHFDFGYGYGCFWG